MNINHLRQGVGTRLVGSEILYFQTIRSTNDTAHRLIDHGQRKDGCVILAEEQTRGRGLKNKSWRSPKGLGLWLSIILFPQAPPRKLPGLTLTFALSTARAIENHTGIPVKVKWPNDLLADGGKLGGILVEAHSRGEVTKQVVVGIGINVNQTKELFTELRLPEATSLRIQLGREVDREKLLIECLRRWDEDYALFQKEGFAPFRGEWEKRDYFSGRELVILDDKGQRQARAVGLDDSGHLVLEEQGGNRITATPGEIKIKVR